MRAWERMWRRFSMILSTEPDVEKVVDREKWKFVQSSKIDSALLAVEE